MHRVVPLKVHYYGTPVVLVSSTNPDGTTNLAPMSSAWWLGQNAMLGLGASSRTTHNLLRTGEGVLNLAPADLVDHVDRLGWDPLIMKFCDYFGDGRPLVPSRLAAGWRMPGRLEESPTA